MMMATIKQSSLLSNFVVKERATLTWTIDEFTKIEEAKSSEFSPPNSDQKFMLELNAKNRLFQVDRIFLELCYDTQDDDVLLYYRISILDANDQKHYTKEYLWHYQEPNHGVCQFNVTSYILRYKCNDYLVNGSLKIYCEVDILGEKSVQSSPQQTNESFGKLSANYRTLLDSQKWTDFIVQIGDKQFRVHKNILATRSAVFAAMFDHDCEEKRENKVTITDMDVEVCEEMLRFVYTGKVESMDKYAMELLEVAEKYQMDSLKSLCEQYLSCNMEIETAANVLILADLYGANGLKAKCLDYITDNANQLKDTEGWKVLNTNAHYKLLGELFLHLASKTE